MEAVALAEEAVVVALPVADVADQRVAEVLQVAPDLVEASGARPDLDERVAPVVPEAGEVADRVDPRASLVVRHRVVDPSLRGRDAAAERPVRLLDRALRERARNLACG